LLVDAPRRGDDRDFIDQVERVEAGVDRLAVADVGDVATGTLVIEEAFDRCDEVGRFLAVADEQLEELGVIVDRDCVALP